MQLSNSNNVSTQFRTEFAQTTFNNKYRHEHAETWKELSSTLVDDVCQSFLDAETKEEMKKLHADMKFIAGGRYLYYAGRPNKFFNNCLSGDTEFLTDAGIKTLEECVGQTVKILSPATQGFLPARIEYFGEQEVYEITFANLRGRSKKRWTCKATRDHRWKLLSGEITTNLQVGDRVPPSSLSADSQQELFDIDGYRHGLIFADGNVHRLKESFGHQLRLCNDKKKYLHYFEDEGFTVTHPKFANGDPVIYTNSKRNLKALPTDADSLGYITSFLKGWLALDGHFGRINQIHSIDRDAIALFEKYAAYIGYVTTGSVLCDSGPTNFASNGRKNPLYRVTFSPVEKFSALGFKVVDIKPLGEQKVYCAVEPEHKLFTLANGMVTGNCYLLRSIEDTREDWSELAWKAQRCLMTGGGIGNDYTIYRGRGAKLSKTGGFASGPVSAMKLVNEIGREVMQGGSRRSAIYASLNWKHADVKEFLHVKDWDAIKIPGTELSLGDLKSKDFNFPAPLDMTNISLNYDNAFLEEVYELPVHILKQYAAQGIPLVVKKVPETFRTNCLQALKTGEPGFSFNFFDRERETLRNACTEVSSEDDSDVCNLGSLNMSRIETKEEFRTAVRLATYFLLCGTLRAHLPYEDVYKVREKNRRLGLGLMGVHEWLLKRGYRYEVVPELHEWLEIYRYESRKAADELADKLGISRPVACRAIAPTGTIGILAGTTTGIEPLFSVAFKRRYLKNGREWHYQYVIDGTAKLLIDQYNLNPEEIETALNLSTDVERRIKFQADIQDYVDMCISSTINLPRWKSPHNNALKVDDFAKILLKYAHRLRGFTCYPDGSRGGQPLTSTSYAEALKHEGQEFKEEFVDICSVSGKGGVCGA